MNSKRTTSAARTSRPKNSCSYSHHRCALLNRDLEIAAHAHGKLSNPCKSAVVQAVAHLAQAAEIRPSLFRLCIPGRDRHQPLQLQLRQRLDEGSERGE